MAHACVGLNDLVHSVIPEVSRRGKKMVEGCLFDTHFPRSIASMFVLIRVVSIFSMCKSIAVSQHRTVRIQPISSHFLNSTEPQSAQDVPCLMGSPPGWHQAVPIRTFSCPWAAWTGLVRSFPRWWMTGAYWVLLAQLAIRVTVRFPEVTAWCKVSRRWFGCLWILSQDWDIGQFGSRSKTVRFFVVAAAIASVAGG